MVVRNGSWLGKEANDVSVGRRLGVISAPSISISAPACTQQCAMAAADLHAAQAVLPNKQLINDENSCSGFANIFGNFFLSFGLHRHIINRRTHSVQCPTIVCYLYTFMSNWCQLELDIV